jgi:Arm DNA-binding domain
MRLTVSEIDGFKPQSSAYRKTDGAGLYLEVFPNGSKLWHFKYRYGGKEKRSAVGAWPETSLTQAREKRDQFRKQVGNGIDPAREKRLARLEHKVNAGHSFADISACMPGTTRPQQARKHCTLPLS